MDPTRPSERDLEERIRTLFHAKNASSWRRPPPESPFALDDDYRPETTAKAGKPSPDPSAVMQAWLRTANPRCDDRPPEEYLRGTEAQREHLGRVLDSIADGGFT